MPRKTNTYSWLDKECRYIYDRRISFRIVTELKYLQINIYK